MAQIQGELVINRPVHEVFDVVADERNEPRYNPLIRRAEKLTRGPIGRGTRFRAEAVTLGRTTGMTIEYRPRGPASGAGELGRPQAVPGTREELAPEAS
jgi:hypothetical protein